MFAEATVKRHSQQIESTTPSLFCRWRNVGFVGRTYWPRSGIVGLEQSFTHRTRRCLFKIDHNSQIHWRAYRELREGFLAAGAASSFPSVRTDSVKRGRFISLAIRAINFLPSLGFFGFILRKIHRDLAEVCAL